MKTKPNSTAFVQLPRSIFSHPFWTQERIYSRAEAWIDLVQTASYRSQQQLVGNVCINIGRGELVASVRYLAARWRWSNGKVLRFMAFMEGEGIIKRRTEHGQTVVGIGNYDMQGNADARTERPSATAPVAQEPARQRLAAAPARTPDTPPDITHDTATEHPQHKYKQELTNTNTEEAPDAAYLQLLDWMQEYTPVVLMLPEALSAAQYTDLQTRMPPAQLRSLLVAMHNYAPLLGRYRSVYHTVLRFAAQETRLKPHTIHTAHEDTLSPASQQLKAAIARRQRTEQHG